MNERHITVIARIKALPTREKDVREELRNLVSPSRSEPGCLRYDLHVATDDTTRFMFVEEWKSSKDLNAHLQQPYLKAFMEKAGVLLADPVEISLWEKIA